MECFAVVLRTRPHRLDGILMLIEDRSTAEEIAFELRRSGQDVGVEIFDDRPKVLAQATA